MIGRLSGVLLEKQPPFILIDVNGVGYECQAPMNTIYQLPEVGQNTILHTHLSVSENAHTLFAFYSLEERKLFRELIKVNGVGPKLALAILSAMSAIEFVQNVHHGEASTLVKIPGVGKKTAERLIIEMKDRLNDWQVEAPVKTDSSQSTQTVSSGSANVQEAVSGLVALGYKPTEASKAISKLDDDSLPASTLIRLALKNMM
ncbi:Holliday junction branch migration protein RuvA [Aliikangiella coralliicola]|uniref:Holliday junction branch migration complex subunit RuvA n=1 Tax=Aliikangiella coralliicola TaxID=2592383 RepID=A0A545UBU6_9GAMM|nr:Holliday junction branch migration protein RuvA [Aliikangiella coralliicola]TQV86938.1 Holliday junction branch migration protein RuvA [Aliikangiella coralliicola]